MRPLFRLHGQRAGALLLLLCACSSHDQAGAPAPGHGEIGAAAGAPADETGSEGGLGGAASSSDLIDGCADLDGDGVADCEATLVENPTFTRNVRSWKALGDAELSWASKNALDDRPSGSAKLSDNTPFASAPLSQAIQCVPSAGETLMIAYANAFVDPGDADESPEAELAVTFFDSDDCSGEAGSYFETPPSSVAGAWTTIQAGGLTSETTRSVSVALVGVKAKAASELTVYFDNVMLKTEPL
jgi:hypothetical protein